MGCERVYSAPKGAASLRAADRLDVWPAGQIVAVCLVLQQGMRKGNTESRR